MRRSVKTTKHKILPPEPNCWARLARPMAAKGDPSMPPCKVVRLEIKNCFTPFWGVLPGSLIPGEQVHYCCASPSLAPLSAGKGLCSPATCHCCTSRSGWTAWSTRSSMCSRRYRYFDRPGRAWQPGLWSRRDIGSGPEGKFVEKVQEQKWSTPFTWKVLFFVNVTIFMTFPTLEKIWKMTSRVTGYTMCSTITLRTVFGPPALLSPAPARACAA